MRCSKPKTNTKTSIVVKKKTEKRLDNKKILKTRFVIKKSSCQQHQSLTTA